MRIPSLGLPAFVLFHGLLSSPARAVDPGSKTADPLTSGREALRISDYPGARTAFASAAPSTAAAVGLGRVDVIEGRYAEAVARLRGLRNVPPEDRIDVALVLAEALAREGELAPAIESLRPWKDDAATPRARLMLGELHLRKGDRTAANALLMSVIADYNDDRITQKDAEGLALVGRAAHLLRSAKDANNAFNEAERAGPHRLETLLWRAELFLDKYDPGHAEEVVKEALTIAPHDPRAQVLLAQVKLDQTLDFESAEHAIGAALAVNPKLSEAFVVKAGLSLRTLDVAGADAAIAHGLSSNPTHLDLLSMRGAARLLDGDTKGVIAASKAVFALDPGYSRFYQIVGEYAEWEHRYDDIVAMMRKATEKDPDDAKSWGDLGLNLIRRGDDAEGTEALRRAFAKDHFNVRVFNTLNLYERDIPRDYATVDAAPFRLRYPRDEQPLLERYVPAMLQRAWGSMVQRYGFTPQHPVGIELYASKEHFSVRTSGLPNVGIQGVCFGKTLAAMTPRAEPFNWGNVLWHELGHVFAIQLSQSRVPRWFTEGLSEYETILVRPEWQREEDPALYSALALGKLPPLVDMNRAFTHAQDGRDVMTAYYASSLLIGYIAERYGMPKIVEMLRLWGEGKRTPEVFQRALGTSASEVDAGFRKALAQRLRRYDGQFVPDPLVAVPLEQAREQSAKEPSNLQRQIALARSLLASRKLPESEKVLEHVLEENPIEPNARYLLAKLWISQDQRAQAGALLVRMAKGGSDGYAVRMLMAELATAAKQWQVARAHLLIAHEFDETMPDAISGLYELAEREHQDDEALRWLTDLAKLEQHDRKVYRKLLEGLVGRKRWDEAKRVGEAAMFVDLESARVHTLFAEALSKSGDHQRSLFELQSALLCKVNAQEGSDLHTRQADEYQALGDAAHAKSERDEALRLAPTSGSARSPVSP